MSILSTVTRGKVQQPHLVLLYGPDGVGKTTWAAGAPAPIFLCGEKGTNHLDVARLTLGSAADLRAAVTELDTEAHSYQTVVIDTLDWVEALVLEEVVAKHGKKGEGIESIPYGKGRVYALEAWRELLPLLDACRAKGMNIIALAHSMVKKFEDPALPQGYDKYSLKLQDGAKTDVAALWREYVDAVLFANWDIAVTTDDKRRAFGDGSRVIFTERRPGFDAKNRLGLPFQIEMSWAAYAKAAGSAAAAAQAAGVAEVVDTAGLMELAAGVADAELREKVEKAIADASADQKKLAAVKARLLTLLNKGKK